MTLVSNLTKVGLPDGIVALPNFPGLALLADAVNGIIWRVNVWTGEHSIAIQDDIFLPKSTIIPIGVDGLRIRNHQLFFTNLAQSLFGRVPISETGSATGPMQIIANVSLGDDFAIAADGTAYIAGDNTLYRVDRHGKVTILVGGPTDLTLEGATSAQFGRTVMDTDVLYVGTNGGLLSPVNGIVHGGQLLAINTNRVDQWR
jgi:hypothetical protein